jgi:hypothetical protein
MAPADLESGGGQTQQSRERKPNSVARTFSRGNEVMLDDVPEVVIQMRKPTAIRWDLVTLEAA